MRAPAKIILYLLTVFVGILIIKTSISYFPADLSKGFIFSKKDVFFNGIYSYAFYFHIVSAPVILFTGLIQFSKRLRIKIPAIHRYTGYIYIIFVLLISAPSALIMGIYANGGLIVQLNFIVLSSLWFYFTIQAYKKIKRKEYHTHRIFMLRSYTLTLSAITLRILSYIFAAIFNYKGMEAYTILVWLSWVPQLLLLEIYFLWDVKSKTKILIN